MGRIQKDIKDEEGEGGTIKDVEVAMCLASLKELPGLFL